MTFKLIEKLTFGTGDRFGSEGPAQLRAVLEARAAGIELVPVWNKSHREHTIVGTEPQSVRDEADAAVAALGYTGPYYVDADHINLGNVEAFLGPSDFFTIDVADAVGQAPSDQELAAFLEFAKPLMGTLEIPGIVGGVSIDASQASAACGKFLAAMRRAGDIYRHIAESKGSTPFVVEVSIDETDTPQSPVELLLILAMLAAEKVPVQTIAPKFTGRFNKGVDYAGDFAQFEREFEADLCVLKWAVKQFALPESLKLSVHSGSDKFSLYPIINRMLRKHDAGLHVKTAGTTWLEEVIGLAEAGGAGLQLAREIYTTAHAKRDELAAPYATVLDIDPDQLPPPSEVTAWDAAAFTDALRHEPANSAYNPHLRQLLHVGFKVA
ncbi:MAG: tagaturonate epimerase family protein, partial [Opitutales bacterium]